jgi:hypothetical protein
MNTSFCATDMSSIGYVRQDFEPRQTRRPYRSVNCQIIGTCWASQTALQPVLVWSKSDEKEELQSTTNTAIMNALAVLLESAQIDVRV